MWYGTPNACFVNLRLISDIWNKTVPMLNQIIRIWQAFITGKLDKVLQNTTKITLYLVEKPGVLEISTLINSQFTKNDI